MTETIEIPKNTIDKTLYRLNNVSKKEDNKTRFISPTLLKENMWEALFYGKLRRRDIIV